MSIKKLKELKKELLLADKQVDKKQKELNCLGDYLDIFWKEVPTFSEEDEKEIKSLSKKQTDLLWGLKFAVADRDSLRQAIAIKKRNKDKKDTLPHTKLYKGSGL